MRLPPHVKETLIARPRRPGELRWPDRTVLGAIVLLLAIATLALIGYATGVEVLKRVFPDLPPMRITTALCLLALAAGIWLKRLPGQRPRSLGSLLGGLIAVVGLLVVIGRLDPFGPLAGTLFAGGESTGLPSPGSGIGLILTGLCLLVLDADPGRHRPAGVLIALTGLLAFGALVGYAYDVEYLRGGGAAAGVPLSSAIAFALAAAALGCLRPQRGLVAALHGEDEIDATGRRLTAIAILAPVVIGLIELAGADAGIYDARVGASLFTVLTVGVLTVLSLTYLSQVRRAESARIEASRNLDRSERSFRAVADSAIEVVVTADNHGRIAYINPAGERCFGWSADQLAGRPLTTLMPERFHAAHTDGLRRYLEQRTPSVIGSTVELVGRRRDGTEFPLTLSLSDWTVEGETFFTGVIADISERVRVEEANRLLAEIVDAADDAILARDLDGMIRSWNGGAERIYGYSAEEAMGRNIRFLVPDDRTQELASILARVSAGEICADYDTERVRKDGKRIAVSLTASPIRDAAGTITGAAIITRDVTRRRQAEQAIEAERGRLAEAQAIARVGSYEMDPETGAMEWSRQMFVNYGLDPEGPTPSSYETVARIHPADRERVLSRLARLREAPVPFDDEYRVVRSEGDIATIEVRARIITRPDGSRRVSGTTRDVTAEREAERAKDEFFGLVSHELRTPLTAIIGYTELIKDFESERLSEQVGRWVDVIDRNARRQLRLVQDLLMLARLEARRFEINDEEVDLAALVDRHIDDVRVSAGAAGVSIELRDPGTAPIRGDSHRLGQVIENLLSNAIKFSPSGGSIAVVLREAGREVVLEVADTGVGIPADELGSVFDRLFRASTAAEMHVQGTGLGLTIAKAIVAEHGGRIEVSSTQGKGTRFRVFLPRDANGVESDPGAELEGRRAAALEDVRGD